MTSVSNPPAVGRARPNHQPGATKSHKKVTLRLKRVDDGTEIILTQRVGDRMTFDYNGMSYGITPTIDDLTQGIQLKIEKLERDKNDEIVSAQELENIVVDAKIAKSSGKSGPPFSLMLRKVWETPSSDQYLESRALSHPPTVPVSSLAVTCAV